MEPAIFSKKKHYNQNHVINNDIYLQLMHFFLLFIYFHLRPKKQHKEEGSKTIGIMACTDVNIKNKIYLAVRRQGCLTRSFK